MFRIVIPHLPPKELQPNRKGGKKWTYSAEAKVEAMNEVIALCNDVGNQKPAKPYQKAHIMLTYVAKDKIRRDLDNLLAASKTYIDALAWAGVIEDDSADLVSYTLRYEHGAEAMVIMEVEDTQNSPVDAP